MNKFSLRGSITDKDFMIHVLDDFPREYDVILDGLETGLMASGDHVITIEFFCKKMNHQYEKMKNKNEEKREKENFRGLEYAI